MFEGIKGGLHAELIRNRGFEEAPDSTGLSRHWERYPDDRIDDYGIVAPPRRRTWRIPSAKQSEGTTGGHSLRVELKPGVIARHGVYQARVPVRQRLEYHGYVWVKTDVVRRRVDGGARSGRDRRPDLRSGADRRTSRATGRSTRSRCGRTATDPHARFAILFEGQGTVWIDQVSLMPGDAVDGVRADVFDRVKALQPGVHPMAGRKRRAGLSLALGHRAARRASDVDQPVVAQRARAERLRHRRVHPVRARVGAEPSITVNVEGRGATVEEAAAWVEYCNGPATSTIRRDARARRPSRAVSRQVLGDRQRDLGRLGARPLGRRDLRAQPHAIRRRHARGRSVDQS